MTALLILEAQAACLNACWEAFLSDTPMTWIKP
jgi:hypothetical protein